MSNIKHGTSSGNANNSKALSESFCCISIICELNESKKKTLQEKKLSAHFLGLSVLPLRLTGSISSAELFSLGKKRASSVGLFMSGKFIDFYLSVILRSCTGHAISVCVKHCNSS